MIVTRQITRVGPARPILASALGPLPRDYDFWTSGTSERPLCRLPEIVRSRHQHIQFRYHSSDVEIGWRLAGGIRAPYEKSPSSSMFDLKRCTVSQSDALTGLTHIPGHRLQNSWSQTAPQPLLESNRVGWLRSSWASRVDTFSRASTKRLSCSRTSSRRTGDASGKYRSMMKSPGRVGGCLVVIGHQPAASDSGTQPRQPSGRASLAVPDRAHRTASVRASLCTWRG